MVSNVENILLLELVVGGPSWRSQASSLFSYRLVLDKDKMVLLS